MAGLLGQVFSAGNVARRKLTDLLGNPVLSAQQIVGNLNDRARVLNEMTSAAAQEGVNYGPASRQLAGLLADAYNPIGMVVYHGSPAKFSRFDPTKIGSGEGAQAYGYGHYVAQNPAVAKDYQRRLAKEAQATDLNTKMQMVDVGGKPLTSFNVDMDATLIDAAKSGKKEFVNVAEAKKARWENLAQDQSYPFQDYAKQKAGAYTSLLDAAKKTDVDYTGTGMFYEIDLPDEQIARMLDWDKPLSKQKDVMAALNNVAENNVKTRVRNEIENQIRSSGVLPVDQTGDDYMSLLFGQSEETIAKANQMLKQLADEQMAKIDFEPLVKSELEGMKPLTMTWDATGKEFYEMLAQRRGSPEAASTLFREQGIPGIRYLDEGSRGRGEGTSNFVVFPGNEGLLTIQKRNNEVIAPTSLLDNSKNTFETSVTDASEIFGEGAKRIRYTDPSSGGMIDVLQRPDGTASVLGLEVPEAMRGQGIGQSLQSQVMQDFPEMMGQVSSKAAAKTAYRLGRRPPNQPDATLDDVYKIMDEYSSVNLVSPEMQKRFMQSLLD